MYRFLILGTGAMAHAHARAFASIPNNKIVAAVDNNPDNLAIFCQEFGIDTHFDNLAQALDWGAFDAALNVTPDAVHYSTTMALLNAGKHVFCEKPLAQNYPHAKEMADTAEAKGLIGMVNLTYRNAAALHHAHELIQAGEIGEVRHFEASYLQSWLVGNHWGDWRTEPRWLWRLSKAHGSLGALGDVGIHILDFTTYGANSEVKNVFCRLKTYDKAPNNQIGPYVLDANDSALLNVELANGACGVIHTTRFATGHANTIRLEINGNKGALRIDLDQSWDHVDICWKNNIHNQAWEKIPAPKVKNNFARFVDALEQGVAQEPSFRRAAKLQQVLDLCIKSDETGQTMNVDA